MVFLGGGGENRGKVPSDKGKKKKNSGSWYILAVLESLLSMGKFWFRVNVCYLPRCSYYSNTLSAGNFWDPDYG